MKTQNGVSTRLSGTDKTSGSGSCSRRELPVVDVGCGTGRAVAELSQRGMRVVGVDLSEQMLDAERDRLPGNDFRFGDATASPLEDSSMDGYRADKVFHELADPGAALAEAWRVLAPGGRVVLVGQDWESFIIDSDDPDLTRTIVTARASAVVSPRVARGFRNLLLDNGFADVCVEVRTVVFVDTLMVPMLSGLAENACAAGAVTREQADEWIAEQTHRGRNDRLMLAMPLFFAAAAKPSVRLR
ncbi:methyltransferase domain-containing protein [Nocardia nova]|uniref:methyltransferase domain-containing protein n=1 Tax=Nocardia nova TaxID=37330 RepID=UPI0025B2610B|nr:methyltransferase domain-containing protein [Nocardia nova]